MKKKFMLYMIISIMLISFTSCKNDDVISIAGLDAKIVQISKNVKGFEVQILNDEEIGDFVYVNCNKEDIVYVYANYSTNEADLINFSDFNIGDEIIITAEISKDNIKAKNIYPTHIQLGTQRLNNIFN